MGLGQSNSLGEYCGLSTASSVFLILLILVVKIEPLVTSAAFRWHALPVLVSYQSAGFLIDVVRCLHGIILIIDKKASKMLTLASTLSFLTKAMVCTVAFVYLSPRILVKVTD